MNDPMAIGRYKIVSRLGQGGLGDLFLAHDPLIDRMVAIKIIREGFDESHLRERFAREARAAGRLRHPNIVTIFDVGEESGRPFIAMEYVPGDTLKALIQRRAGLTLTTKLKLLEELCDGLSYAHKSGLVHRDVKPANLMLDADGVLKILDFGIVRFASSGMTQAGMLIGTLGYMSPEQITGRPIDHRSDIFGVGGVAYELISYRQAFPGSLTDGILGRVLNSQPEPLEQICPHLDPEVIAIIGRALEKDPAARYQDLTAMRRDLARARQRLEADADADAPSEPITDGALGRPSAESSDTALPAPRRPSLEALPEAHARETLDAAERVDVEGRELLDDAARKLELANERGHLLAEALARARSALAASAADSAARAADEVLARDPQHAEALQIKEQASAALAEKRRLTEDERAAADQPKHTQPDATILVPAPMPSVQPSPRDRPVDDGTALFLPAGMGETDVLPDVQLVVSSGNPLLIGRAFKVTSRSFHIGRTSGELTLPEPSWTRRHAVIEYSDAGFAIRDLGSSNGTYVNGRLVRGPEPLFFGAAIQVGKIAFSFMSGRDTSVPELTGSVVADRYVLKKLLRESAKGVVYLARHKHFGGEVVIKLLSPELVRYPGYREQFQREAEMAAELRHPHICQVIDYGPVEICSPGLRPISTQFLCLEFMAGGTLADRLEAKAAFEPERLARWVRVLADALQYSHRHQVIHGNVKPTSVVFDADENVYLTDFAIAQRVSSGEGKPVMGTAAFMAPEQWDTAAVTAAIDQFALASLAYYTATGSRPFEGQDHPDVRKQNFRRGPMPAHEEGAQNGRQLSPAVSRVLRKALATLPSERYPSVADFGEAFAAALTGTRISGGVPQVFLSYQREGAAGWAQYFARELKDRHGVSVFVDVERRDGAGRFPARLARAIQECDVFVVLLGSSTLESKWVREEIKLAYEHGRPMVPVFQESWLPPDVQPGADPPLETLISYDGVHLLDRRNIHVDHTIADLARMVKQTAARKSD